MNFLKVPGGFYRIGTTKEGLNRCVSQWRQRLINPCYSEADFRDWISKECPAHEVEVPTFYLSETLISNKEAEIFVEATGSKRPESLSNGDPEDHPVWGVSLEWAKSYAGWLSSKDSKAHYRLPREEEWEAAARGFDFREYPYGENFNSKCANTKESGIGSTTPIRFFKDFPGPFGHLDLAGNVEEWVDSLYTVYKGGEVVRDDLFERFGVNYPILRGGSFACGGDLSRGARRHGPFPDPLFRYTGFRLVREER